MAADYTLIYKNLAVGGGIFTTEGMKELAKDGFTHIIDCQAEFDDTPLAKPYGIQVLWVPLFDDFTSPDFKEFKRVEAFVKHNFVQDVKQFKLLIHCAAGVHRGPMVAYLVCRLLGADTKLAITSIEYLRDIASLHSTYRGAVDKYLEKKIESRNKRS